MNIYCEKGHKVKFINWCIEQVRWGNNNDPKEYLIMGNEYEVSRTNIRSSHTKIEFIGFEGKWFNSTHFEDVRS